LAPHPHQSFPVLVETLPHRELSSRPTPVRELSGLGIWVNEDGAFGSGRSLDPVYAAKAMAGLEGSVLFVMTDGPRQVR